LEPSIEKCRQILSVSTRAPLREIKEAYLDLAKVWHPDRFAGNSRLEKKATEKLAEINRAYEILLAFYEAGGNEGGMDGPEEVRRAYPPPNEEARGNMCEMPKRHGFFRILMTLCAIAIILIGVTLMVKQRRAEVPVKVILPSPAPESGPESAPKKRPLRSQKSPEKTDTLRPGKQFQDRSGSFTLGSTKEEVLAAQGPPQQISESRWSYGPSWVEFAKGRVIGWYNSTLDSLKVKVIAKAEPERSFFTLGSTKEEVAALQGTPTQISGNRWSYGFSRVDFARGKVVGWYNSAMDPLRIKLAPKSEPERFFFRVGSTKEEVLAVQGTPTQLTENRWSYGYSYVEFENGKVVKWYNSEQDPLAIEEE
jgi:hypothetical protein